MKANYKTGVSRGRRYWSATPAKPARVRHADPFDVWGRPPPLLRTISKRQERSLKRYISKIATNAYRLAYDLGAARKSC